MKTRVMMTMTMMKVKVKVKMKMKTKMKMKMAMTIIVSGVCRTADAAMLAYLGGVRVCDVQDQGVQG